MTIKKRDFELLQNINMSLENAELAKLIERLEEQRKKRKSKIMAKDKE